MKITGREIAIAFVSCVATSALWAAVQASPPILGSTAVEWGSAPVQKSAVGEARQFLRAPTATLDELEVHVTTLEPGKSSHAPHRHPNEELVLMKEGTVEVLVNGEWKRVGPGSVVFNASNQLHGIRNAGDGPATYFVVNWTSPGMGHRR